MYTIDFHKKFDRQLTRRTVEANRRNLRMLNRNELERYDTKENGGLHVAITVTDHLIDALIIVVVYYMRNS